MKTVLVFDIETIPDADGLRKLGDYSATMTDIEVIEKATAARR